MKIFKLKSIIFTIILLFITASLNATSPLRPEQKYNFHGPNVGIGGFYSYAGNKLGSGGGYWFETGYTFPSFIRTFSLNAGIHQIFFFKNKNDFTLYLDVSGFFLSAGPILVLRNRERFFGGFCALNIPIITKWLNGKKHSWLGDRSGDLVYFPFLQIRGEFLHCTTNKFYIGFMYKFDFLIFYKEAPKFNNN